MEGYEIYVEVIQAKKNFLNYLTIDPMHYNFSPAFTGSKMRQMFKLIVEVAEDNMNHLKSIVKDDVLDVELYDLLSR